MGNNNSNEKNQKILDKKSDLKLYLTRSNISDISIFYNYEKKYIGIDNERVKSIQINNNFAYIICGLIDGFILIYNILNNSELKLSISFQAHREMIIKVNQLRKSGFLLTSSYDNSLKVFKLSSNCTKETLIYKFYLNPIFNRINDLIQINNDDILLISVFNHIIYFPYNKNNLSENKNNLSDYDYSKIEHRKNYLSNLLEINEKLFLALDKVGKNILFFNIIPSENIAKKINLVKNVFINLKVDNKDNSWNDKICIENLLPKYKYILVSIYNYISIIDIKYLEIICSYEMKMNSFHLFYNKKIDRILIFEGNNLHKYKINNEKYEFYFVEENIKSNELFAIDRLEIICKIINHPFNENNIFFFYKNLLIKMYLNFS